MNPTVTMTLEEWNLILSLLAEHPFRQVANTIGKLQTQVQQQVDQGGLRPNGHGAPLDGIGDLNA